MRTKKETREEIADYFNHAREFIGGATEALYKVGVVSTAKGLAHMHDKGWQLTQIAEHRYHCVVTAWFYEHYKSLCKLSELGVEWYQMGIDWLCSIQHEGTGFFDVHTGVTHDREKLKRLGKKLHKLAQSAYHEEAFLMYVKRGKYCEFQFPIKKRQCCS